MPKSDRELGMSGKISRRDFIHDGGLAALGLALPSQVAAGPIAGDSYPPTLTGMRGSHPGSFEVAHALARDGKQFGLGVDRGESYDLIVVGGGISGLAAAYFYRERFGKDARILILENHDDFGGHAKRNEFRQGDAMRLAWGGTQNLEYPYFSDLVNRLLGELGVDIPALVARKDFHYGYAGFGPPAIWFDADTYGRDVLVKDFALRFGNRDGLQQKIARFPLSESCRRALLGFYARNENVMEGRDSSYLSSMSYVDFLRRHGGLPDEAIDLFINTTHGYAGIGADCLSVAECRAAGLPMLHLLGLAGQEPAGDQGGEVAMFPDGNATIARLLVRALVPSVTAGGGTEDIAMQTFDYARLDEEGSTVRLRLNATVVRADNGVDGPVAVSYVEEGQTWRVRGRHGVLACDHGVIPHLCPDLPAQQKEALAYQVKHPLLTTNVLIRSDEPFRRLQISGAYCPGRLHGMVWPCKGVNTGGYRDEWTAPSAVPVQFWGSIRPPRPGLPAKDQLRASRARMLGMSFADFEREVRTVLDGMLAPAGFDVTRDILAITVNRWPHGYSYGYLDLWDPDWPAGQAPHEIARRRHGNISIANADAAAEAYTHTAIEQAYRAIGELRA
jgi:spermidine dehydrogenase